MTRVLCLNDYDVAWFREPSPDAPRHLLYGLDSLHAAGLDVQLADTTPIPFLKSLQRASARLREPIRLGDLSQQRNALRISDHADLIYCLTASVGHVLFYARALGLIRTPILCLNHHPWERGRYRLIRWPSTRLALRGIDQIITLTTPVSDEINRLARSPSKAHPLPWGPDLDFYPPFTTAGRGVVASGRTHRDFATLARAAENLNYPVMICTTSSLAGDRTSAGSDVHYQLCPNADAFSWRELFTHYSSAAAIAIPMYEREELCGLTSIADALAMGRAMICTVNKSIGLDIEAEGIGIWVEPGDTAGWKRALAFVRDNPAETAQMGVRARRLAENTLNSRRFGAQLLDIVKTLTSVSHHRATNRRKPAALSEIQKNNPTSERI